MSLLEAWDYEVTRREAVIEVLLHGASINDFYDECGYHNMYMGSDHEDGDVTVSLTVEDYCVNL
jgi:hypothetical protein